MEFLRSAGATLSGAYKALAALASAAAQMEPLVEPESEIAYWLGAVRRQSEDLRTDLDWLAPWLSDSPHQGQDRARAAFSGLDTVPARPGESGGLCPDGTRPWRRRA